MSYGIAQFMWGFQHHFRRGLERVAADVFTQIGFGLGPRAYLVGFTDDEDAPNSVCVEPETEELAEIDLSQVVNRGSELYIDAVDSQTIITSERHHERFHRSLRDSMRAQALQEALEADLNYADRYFFVGSSAKVGDYDAHPIISVPRPRWDSRPALSQHIIDRMQVVPSLQHALMRELLHVATSDLGRAEPPEEFSLAWSDRSELIRAAARRFMQSISVYGGYGFGSELRVALDDVSALPYEGRPSSGGLLLAAADNEHVTPVLQFTEPIRLSETRSLRKALELANAKHHLWCDGEKVLGLAELSDKYEDTAESAFTFNIVSRGSWELSHAAEPLLRMTNTKPSLPESPLSDDQVTSVASRVFPEASEDDLNHLLTLTRSATDASHGTLLVVHRHAAREAQRLVPQAQQVAPMRLTPEVLQTITNIDGAVLVDAAGMCHAIGVILDGHANGKGDSSRGARYNSAVRYQSAQSGDCLVIIVSEDGMIDLLPKLPRVVSRSAIEAAVRKVEEVAAKDPSRLTHLEEFGRVWDHLEAVAFYLDGDQCARANEARERLEIDRARLGVTVTGWRRMESHPDLNESYFI